jgi:hypothetical protein
MPRLSTIAIAQGAYYLVTGLWPVFHMNSFLALTGPKTDLWLVRTFGVLIAAIGAHFLLASVRRNRPPLDLRPLAMLVAGAIAGCEAYYALTGQIWAVYLLDAVLELAFVGMWSAHGWRRRLAPVPAPQL